MSQYIYTMNRVSKVVPPKRQIIKDISLSFFPGAKIGLLGRLRVARPDQGAQVVGELALLLDGLEHHGLAVLEFAQVGEAFFDGAQLAVVEAAGGLLAVAGDEGHGVALVEELHGGGDVRLIHPEFAGDGGLDHSGESSGPATDA